MKRADKSNDREKGHLMAGLMAAVAIMMIFSTMAFQSWSEVLRRDNEAEMMFRAQDLVRAIQRYRRDNGGMGPEKLEQLLEPGPKRQYYARQIWTDPLVRDGKWGLLYFGPGGAVIDPSNEVQAGGLGGGLGQQGQAGGNRFGQQGQQSGLSGMGQTGQQGQQGQQQGGLNQAGQLGGVGNRNNQGGQVGGLRIAGVKSLSEDKPFRVYNGYTAYKDWLFSVLDLEQQTPGQGGAGGRGKGPFSKGKGPGGPNQPGNGFNQPGNGSKRPDGFNQGRPGQQKPSGNLTPKGGR